MFIYLIIDRYERKERVESKEKDVEKSICLLIIIGLKNSPENDVNMNNKDNDNIAANDIINTESKDLMNDLSPVKKASDTAENGKIKFMIITAGTESKTETDWTKLKVDDLKAELSKSDITFPKNAKKNELVDLLKNQAS